MLFPDFSVWGVTFCAPWPLFCVSCKFEKLILGRFKSEELIAPWSVYCLHGESALLERKKRS